MLTLDLTLFKVWRHLLMRVIYKYFSVIVATLIFAACIFLTRAKQIEAGEEAAGLETLVISHYISKIAQLYTNSSQQKVSTEQALEGWMEDLGDGYSRRSLLNDVTFKKAFSKYMSLLHNHATEAGESTWTSLPMNMHVNDELKL